MQATNTSSNASLRKAHPTKWMLAEQVERDQQILREKTAKLNALYAHRRRQYADMNVVRPTSLVEGILYDLEHLERFGLGMGKTSGAATSGAATSGGS